MGDCAKRGPSGEPENPAQLVDVPRPMHPDSNLDSLCSEIKRLIVKELNLEGRDPSSIADDAPLFGEGLGLDSLDALQLAVALEEQMGVRIPDGDETRVVFRSVRALAEHVAKVRGT
jgi:acyl carrier protein